MAASRACKSHYTARVQHQALEDAGDSGLHPFPEGMRTGSVSDGFSAHRVWNRRKPEASPGLAGRKT